jgi:TetR/AcrR family transcriptional regulator, cholesterol catabolism regulator
VVGSGGGVSVRRHQKQATRARVLEAARELFDSLGYESTTVRDIARKAGVSVGSVFTTFSAKSEILSYVMQERLDGLYGELDRVAANLRGSTADRLRSIFAIHYALEARQARLFLAHVAAAFDTAASADAPSYGRNPRLRAMLRDCLTEGCARGDVHARCDLEQVIDLLLAAYAWTYRLAAQEGADMTQMSRVMDQQIGLIAKGYGAAPDAA